MAHFSVLFATLWFLSSSSTAQESLLLNVNLTQTIESNGFHHVITWDVKRFHPESNLSDGDSLVMHLRLPAGCFFDDIRYYQLNPRHSNDLFLHIPEVVDMESMAHRASPSNIYFYFTHGTEFQVSLPINSRYHRAKYYGGFETVIVERPQLLVRFSRYEGKTSPVKAPCKDNTKEVCVWSKVDYYFNRQAFELKVPIGDLRYYPVVTFITLGVSFFSAIKIYALLWV